MIFAYLSFLPYIGLWLSCMLFIVWWRFFTIRHRMKLFIAHHGQLMFRNWSIRILLFKSILYSLVIISLWLALLGPQGEQKEEMNNVQKRALIIALDVSKSMLAQDCLPNRLSCAKEKILTLMNELHCDSVGLILFSGTAIVMCPLTSDYEAFKLFLHEVSAETISASTTALDQALRKIQSMFDALPERRHKLAMIATDGEDFSTSLAAAKDEVTKRGIHMLTLGLGTAQGAPIPLYDEHNQPRGHLRDDEGNVVISRLNEGILQALSRDSDARYIRATNDNADIAAMVSWIHSFEKEGNNVDKTMVDNPYYMYPTFVALLLLGIEWII